MHILEFITRHFSHPRYPNLSINLYYYLILHLVVHFMLQFEEYIISSHTNKHHFEHLKKIILLIQIISG